MFEYKDVYKCMRHQDALGHRLMIDSVIVSSDLRLYVPDNQVKRS